jgi:hypothetical protein
MFNHSLIFLALMSFSIASTAAAIPMDADLAAVDATPNAVLHKEVVVSQGGDSNKDVDDDRAEVAPDSPAPEVPALRHWFPAQDDDCGFQPLAVLMLIIGLAVFFLSRNSSSTK